MYITEGFSNEESSPDDVYQHRLSFASEKLFWLKLVQYRQDLNVSYQEALSNSGELRETIKLGYNIELVSQYEQETLKTFSCKC